MPLKPSPDLVDQPTSTPTRKVTAATAGGALAAAIATAIMSWLPESAAEVESSVRTIIEWVVGVVFAGGGALVGGYMTRERRKDVL